MRIVDWLIAVLVFGALAGCVVLAIAYVAAGEPTPMHLS